MPGSTGKFATQRRMGPVVAEPNFPIAGKSLAYSVTDNYTISVLAIALTYLAIGPPSSGAWVVFGSAIRQALRDPRRARPFNLTMAALLVASIVPIFWQ